MRISQFEYLVSLEKYKSFSKTAQHIFVAQSSISQAVKELEDEMGFMIIRRSNKGISFTPQGKLVLDKAKKIMQEIESLEEMKLTGTHSLLGDLSIGISPHILSFLLTDLVINFKADYPNLNILHKEADSLSIISDIIESKIDLGILFLCKPDRLEIGRRIHQNGFESYDLFTGNMRFVARKGHPLFQRDKKITLADTVHYPHVVYSNAVRQMIAELYRDYGMIEEVTTMNNYDGILYYITQTNAITLVIDQLFLKETKRFPSDELQPLLIDGFVSECTAICIRNSSPLTEIEKLILNYMKSAY